jgi:hypothetical protein
MPLCLIVKNFWTKIATNFVLFHVKEHQNFLRLLTETEDWLYEEGEDQAKQAYVDKLEELMVGSSLKRGTCILCYSLLKYNCDGY